MKRRAENETTEPSGKGPPSAEEEAMDKAKKLLQGDEGSSSSFVQPLPAPQEFVGFAWRSGRQVDKAAEVLHDDVQTESAGGQVPEFAGFQRAGSKKPVPPPSEEAVRRAQKLMVEDDPDPAAGASQSVSAPPPVFAGFQCAGSKKPVPPPSVEALRRAQKLTEDTQDPSQCASATCTPMSTKRTCGEAAAAASSGVVGHAGTALSDAELLERMAGEEDAGTQKNDGALSTTDIASLVAGIDMEAEFGNASGAPAASSDLAMSSEVATPLKTTPQSVSASAAPSRVTRFPYPAPVVVTPSSKIAKSRVCKTSTPVSVVSSRTVVSGKRGFKSPMTSMLSLSTPSTPLSTPAPRCLPAAVSSANQQHQSSSSPPRLTLESLAQAEVELCPNGMANLVDYFRAGLLADVPVMTSESAKHFLFRAADLREPCPEVCANAEGTIGPAEMLAALGCSEPTVNLIWVQNHWRWILWKLSSLERRFPCQLGGRCVTPQRVLSQLNHRVEREVVKAQRSAVKRIFERDAISARLMVLCVASIVDLPAPSAAAEAGPPNSSPDVAVVELTDGWYGIRATFDPGLTALVRAGKIFPGQKLRLFGAQRIGEENGMAPLERPDAISLKVCLNGTRRALWDAKLGFQRERSFPVNLASVRADGGLVPCLDVVVLRKFPLLFVECKDPPPPKDAEDEVEAPAKKRKSLCRTEKEEELFNVEHEAKMHQTFEERLAAATVSAVAPPSDAELAGMQEEVVQEFARDVFSLLRLHVRECPAFLRCGSREDLLDSEEFAGSLKECILTIKSPAPDFVESLQEGAWMRLFGLAPSQRAPPKCVLPRASLSPVQLCITGSSPWLPLPLGAAQSSQSVKGLNWGPAFTPRRVLRVAELPRKDLGELFDFAGVALGTSVQKLDDWSDEVSLYATDASEDLLIIRSRRRREAAQLPEAFPIGREFTVMNLVLTNHDPSYGVEICEASDFVQYNPPLSRQPHLSAAFREFRSWLQFSSRKVNTLVRRVAALIGSQ